MQDTAGAPVVGRGIHLRFQLFRLMPSPVCRPRKTAVSRPGRLRRRRLRLCQKQEMPTPAIRPRVSLSGLPQQAVSGRLPSVSAALRRRSAPRRPRWSSGHRRSALRHPASARPRVSNSIARTDEVPMSSVKYQCVFHIFSARWGIKECMCASAFGFLCPRCCLDRSCRLCSCRSRRRRVCSAADT